MMAPENISHEHDYQDALYKEGFSLLGAVMFEWKDNKFIWQNLAQAANILTARKEQVPTDVLGLVEMLSPDGIEARRSGLRGLTWDGASYKCTYQVLRFDGEYVWLEEIGKRVSGEGKKPTHIIGTIRDIHQNKLAEQRAAYAAHHDQLTGLWNKTRLIEDLSQTIAAAQRYEKKAAFIAVQIVNLEEINETYGYDAGDRLIAGVAERLKSTLRIPDFAARLSGDKFAVVKCDCDMLAMAKLTSYISELLYSASYSTPYGDIYGNFAFGAVQIPEQASSPHEVRNFANLALYHSRKRQGVYVAYDPKLAPETTPYKYEDIGEADILDALNSRRLRLAYQPIVHASTREPHHYECLLRLRREDGVLIPAGDFIKAAERLSLVHLLDRRALEIASETLREVPDIHLALNVSAMTVKNEMAAREYIRALKALGSDSIRLSVELTETAAMDDPARASQFSNDARALGCTFAIDDFGAGYTTFQNLMAIEADEIKIDGSFIREISVTPHKQTFVRMMVDLAQTFSVKTVAEFVNSREDADLLTRLGVDYLQGYMFGVPSASPDWPRPQKTVVPAASSIAS